MDRDEIDVRLLDKRLTILEMQLTQQQQGLADVVDAINDVKTSITTLNNSTNQFIVACETKSKAYGKIWSVGLPLAFTIIGGLWAFFTELNNHTSNADIRPPIAYYEQKYQSETKKEHK